MSQPANEPTTAPAADGSGTESSLREAAKSAARGALSGDDDGSVDDVSDGAEGQVPDTGTVEPGAAKGTEEAPEGDDADGTDAGKSKRPSRKERREQYKLEQEKRYARQAKREREQTQQLLQQVAQRQAELDARDAKLREFDEEVARDPEGALRRRYGLTPDKLLAGQADAQAEDPRIAARFAKLEQMFERDRKEREEREKTAAEHARHQKQRDDIEHDIGVLAGEAQNGGKEQFPDWYKLGPKLRRRLARDEVMRRVLRRNRGEEVDYTEFSLLDSLDDQAREILEEQGDGASTDQGEGTRERPNGRAKTPGRANARAAAEPANRQPPTERDLREAAKRAAREEISSRRR